MIEEEGTGSHPGLHRIAAVQARDAALSLVARANRWLIAAAVLVAGGLTALTAHAFHAKAATTTPQSSSALPQAALSQDNSGSGNTGSVAPPSSAPAPVNPAPMPVAPVVSGGS